MSYASESQLKNIKESKPLTLNKQLTPYNLTIKELKNFNGKEGKKAFIAVDETIYDVSGQKSWVSGNHKGVNAGQDVSKEIQKAPHGMTVLEKLNIIGKLVGTPDKE
jgi:predicted heme/steroid binding protein